MFSFNLSDYSLPHVLFLKYSSTNNDYVFISEPLFELLVEISSKDCDNLDNEECGERLTSIATSCLLSLIIAWGVTPKLLQALAHLITATHALADQEITVSNPTAFVFSQNQ